MMLQLVRHGVAATVSALIKEIEIDLHLMVGNIGVISAPYSVPLLIDRIEQAEVVTRRLEVI